MSRIGFVKIDFSEWLARKPALGPAQLYWNIFADSHYKRSLRQGTFLKLPNALMGKFSTPKLPHGKICFRTPRACMAVFWLLKDLQTTYDFYFARCSARFFTSMRSVLFRSFAGSQSIAETRGSLEQRVDVYLMSAIPIRSTCSFWSKFVLA